MESLPLTVLIPTHGRPTLLKRTLDSLVQCELPESYEELVVIENGSRAGADELVASLPERLNARYMHREPGNKSYALNEAMRTIFDGLVVFFDDDVRVEPQVLAAYKKAGSTATGRARYFFGGPFSVRHEEVPPEWMLAYLPPSAKGCLYNGGVGVDKGFTGFLGFNWAAYASDIKDLGGFNINRGPGAPSGSTGQETNMQKRLVASGAKARYVDQARVTHYVPRDSCTPEWALARSFRSGVKDGLNYAQEHDINRVPFWLIKALLNGTCGRLSIFRNQRQRYDAKYWLKYHRGFMHGVEIYTDRI